MTIITTIVVITRQMLNANAFPAPWSLIQLFSFPPFWMLSSPKHLLLYPFLCAATSASAASAAVVVIAAMNVSAGRFLRREDSKEYECANFQEDSCELDMFPHWQRNLRPHCDPNNVNSFLCAKDATHVLEHQLLDTDPNWERYTILSLFFIKKCQKKHILKS